MRRLVGVFGVTVLTLLAFTADGATAQEARTVRGQVTSATTAQPLPGVAVTVVGTQIGTLTDDAGRYVLRGVPSDADSLSFQRIGYEATTRAITGSTVNARLARAAAEMEGITVTAMGIERQQRSLGYSVQTLSGDETAEVPESSFLNSLQGKVSGAQITGSSYPGGSTRITLRGESSITGENQPLIVIDDVPLTNSHGGAGTYSGFDYGNAANIINPNNIASINVLKGASAAALYGSRAANGAIIIETKSGRGARSGWQMTQTVETARPLRLPNYQNRYGQGQAPCAYTAETGCEAEFKWVDGAGGGINDYFDESWGPPMNGQPVDQWFGEGAPFTPAPNNVRNFFETGFTSRTNISFSGSSESVHGRFGFTYENQQGMAPGNEMENISASLRGGVELNEDLTLDASAQYIRDLGQRRPGTGYSDQNFMQQFVWFGRQVDIEKLEDWRCQEGERACQAAAGRIQENWNYNFHDNPYLIQFGNNNFDETDRVIGNITLSYDMADWLTGSVQTGVDWFREHRKREYMIGSQISPQGEFEEENLYQRSSSSRLLLQAEGIDLTSDLTLSGNAGASLGDYYNSTETIDVAQLNVPGIYTVNNAGIQPAVSQYTGTERVYSLFGDATLGFRDYAFLSFTGRNDWSSTLPEDSRSYFYPSVSSSVVFTDALQIESDLLTYGKVRGAWSQVGADTDPFQLQQTFGIERRWGGIPGYTVPNELPNLELQPEQTESWEAGIDLGFWDGRLAASYTYYTRTTDKQIMPVQVSAASGYTGQVTNAGSVRNRGHEVQLRGRPIDGEDFSWEVSANWSMNDNTVLDLAGDQTTLVLDTYWNGTLEAREGEPYGVLVGLDFETNDQGEPILTETPFGPLPARDGTKEVLAESRPDWTANLTNEFSYKAFDLSFTLDGQMGGALFSTTKWFGKYAGVLEETLRGRENGPCDPGIHLEGVNESGEPVSGTVCPQAYFENVFNSTRQGLVDQTYMKLRNARLAYRVPESFANRLGFSRMNVALIGKNLLLFSDAEHIDPEHAVRSNNIQGWEHGQFPTARTIGMTLSVTP